MAHDRGRARGERARGARRQPAALAVELARVGGRGDRRGRAGGRYGREDAGSGGRLCRRVLRIAPPRRRRRGRLRLRARAAEHGGDAPAEEVRADLLARRAAAVPLRLRE